MDPSEANIHLAFIDEMRAEGYAVESILRVLRQQGLGIAARTYRAWKRPARIAARTVTDALVEDKVRDRDGNPVPPGSLVAHSDAGAQYTSIRYTEHLDLEGIAPSIGTVGDAYDCQSLSTRFRKDWGVPTDAV